MAQVAVGTLQLTKTAFELLAHFPLRTALFYDGLATVQTTEKAPRRGLTERFYLPAELAEVTTPLTETSDITPVTMSDGYVDITLAEYGNGIQTTAQLRATAYIEVNPIIANLLGWNAGASIDSVAKLAIQAGTNVRYANSKTARNNLAATDVLVALDANYPTAKMRGTNIQPWGDGLYRSIIHPDVAYDFRQQTSGNTWVDPKKYQDTDGIYNAVIGAFGGARYMESSRAPSFVNASNGSGSTGFVDTYRTLYIGQEAIAKAHGTAAGYGNQPVFVDAPQVDFLRRFEGLGWKHFVGYGIFRQAAIWAVESASSIANNTS